MLENGVGSLSSLLATGFSQGLHPSKSTSECIQTSSSTLRSRRRSPDPQIRFGGTCRPVNGAFGHILFTFVQTFLVHAAIMWIRISFTCAYLCPYFRLIGSFVNDLYYPLSGMFDSDSDQVREQNLIELKGWENC